MNEKKTVTRSGMSFTSVLTIIFIILKVAGVIDWPWIWVLSPLWISLALFVLLLLIFLFVFLAISIAGEYMKDD